jgi:dTDP-4-amino-4,6-dideoxygalactose transaminase
LADKLRLLKAFGVDRSHGERKIPGMYDVVALGFNYRMSEIHAAIGIEQLKKLPEFLKVRKNNFEILELGLASQEGGQVIPQPVNDRFISSHYCLGFLLDQPVVKHRAKIMEELSIQKIGSSVYYPQPVPRMKYYKDKYGYEAEIYKNAERISDGMIALPVGPHLDDGDMLRISQALQVIMETLSD